MNKIVLTLVVGANARMDRLHELGELVTAGVRDHLKSLKGKGKIEAGEVMIGQPGYGVVLTVTARAQDRPLIIKNRGVGSSVKPVKKKAQVNTSS